MNDNDVKFMTDIIAKICGYAIKSGYNPDDTLQTVAENILKILEVSTFNGWRES